MGLLKKGKDKSVQKQEEETVANDKIETLSLDATALENIRIEADRFLRFFDNLREEVKNSGGNVNPKSSSVVMSRRSSQDLSRLLKDFRGMLSPKKK